MSTEKKTRRVRVKRNEEFVWLDQRTFSDGNVGANESLGRGFGDIRLWVETKEGYKHPLYVTVEEAERLADCLDALLEAIEEDK